MAKFMNRQEMEFKKLDGDFVFEVISVEKTISAGAKTRGSDKYTLKLKEKSSGAFAFDSLIDCETNEACSARIDCFCKSFGVPVEMGKDIDLSAENLVGRCGWATSYHEPSKDKPGDFYNRIRRFITNKEKLPRNEPLKPVDDDENKPW